MQKQFIFNKDNVFLNADIELLVNSKIAHCEIQLAEKDGRWYYGYYFCLKQSPYTGTSSGASFSPHKNSFESKNEARKAVIQAGIYFFQRIEGQKNTIEALQSAINPQLTLF